MRWSSFAVQQYDFCRLCLRISSEFNSVQQKMAGSPSAGCEIQDENGEKAFQLLKNSGLSHACTVIKL